MDPAAARRWNRVSRDLSLSLSLSLSLISSCDAALNLPNLDSETLREL
jgi:hypothetical protein